MDLEIKCQKQKVLFSYGTKNGYEVWLSKYPLFNKALRIRLPKGILHTNILVSKVGEKGGLV